MRKTPEEFKRENIKELFDKILKSHQIKLNPLNISVNESFKADFTSVEMSINETSQGVQGSSFDLKECEAKGFVDGMFKCCHNHYSKDYPSLNSIRLLDYQVTPRIKKTTKTMGTEAKIEVAIMVDVRDHGASEFTCTSRSILHSTFIATLEVFEFYINCEKAFHKIQLVLDDANLRNRADIIQSCVSDLSKLTEVNSYVKKKV